VGGVFSVRLSKPVSYSAVAALTGALIAVSGLVAPTPARAAAPAISQVRVAAVSASGFTVTLASLGSDWRYRLYASTYRPEVYYDNLASTPYRSALSSTPRVTVSGLPYTTKPYWYRVQATNGRGTRTSEIFSLGLRPATPTGLTLTRLKGAPSLAWSGGASNGAQVQQATDARFTVGVRTYTVRGLGRQLTPYGLRSGTRYWFRVRSVNSGTPSGFSAAVSATATARGQDVRTMTYNILTLAGDGTKAAGGTISPWSQRRLAAARYINMANPHVIAVQEGAAWVGAPRGARQVDDLVAVLGGTYGLAVTEVPPNQPGYFRTSSYVLYRRSAYSPVGVGGHWKLGDMPEGGSRWGAYQVLRDRRSGASFLFVSTHLYGGAGLAGDRVRRTMTESLLSQSRAYAARHGGLPIVYAGDFNSHEGHAMDGPTLAMNQARVADGLLVAQTRARAQYNSANQYFRKPPATGHSVDHIYASPGVALRGWGQFLPLSADGTFVGVIPSDHNPVVVDLTYPY